MSDSKRYAGATGPGPTSAADEHPAPGPLEPDTLDAGLAEIRDRPVLYYLTREQYTTLADYVLDVCRAWGSPERTTGDMNTAVLKMWEHLIAVGIADRKDVRYTVDVVDEPLLDVALQAAGLVRDWRAHRTPILPGSDSARIDLDVNALADTLAAAGYEQVQPTLPAERAGNSAGAGSDSCKQVTHDEGPQPPAVSPAAFPRHVLDWHREAARDILERFRTGDNPADDDRGVTAKQIASCDPINEPESTSNGADNSAGAGSDSAAEPRAHAEGPQPPADYYRVDGHRPGRAMKVQHEIGDNDTFVIEIRSETPQHDLAADLFKYLVARARNSAGVGSDSCVRAFPQDEGLQPPAVCAAIGGIKNPPDTFQHASDAVGEAMALLDRASECEAWPSWQLERLKTAIAWIEAIGPRLIGCEAAAEPAGVKLKAEYARGLKDGSAAANMLAAAEPAGVDNPPDAIERLIDVAGDTLEWLETVGEPNDMDHEIRESLRDAIAAAEPATGGPICFKCGGPYPCPDHSEPAAEPAGVTVLTPANSGLSKLLEDHASEPAGMDNPPDVLKLAAEALEIIEEQQMAHKFCARLRAALNAAEPAGVPRVCSKCEKPIRRMHKWRLIDGRPQHRNCEDPISYTAEPAGHPAVTDDLDAVLAIPGKLRAAAEPAGVDPISTVTEADFGRDRNRNNLRPESDAAEPAGPPACDCGWKTRVHSTDCARYKYEHRAAEPAGERDGWKCRACGEWNEWATIYCHCKDYVLRPEPPARVIAAELAGPAARTPAHVYDVGFKDGRAAADLDWCKAKHAATEPAGDEKPSHAWRCACGVMNFRPTDAKCWSCEKLPKKRAAELVGAGGESAGLMEPTPSAAEPAGVAPDLLIRTRDAIEDACGMSNKAPGLLFPDTMAALDAAIDLAENPQRYRPWVCRCGCNNQPKQMDCYSCGQPRPDPAEPAGADNPPDVLDTIAGVSNALHKAFEVNSRTADDLERAIGEVDALAAAAEPAGREQALRAAVGSMKLVPDGMTAAEYLGRNRAKLTAAEPAGVDLVCRICGCTSDNCAQCIKYTGEPCHWIEPDLCSACEFAQFVDHRDPAAVYWKGFKDGGAAEPPGKAGHPADRFRKADAEIHAAAKAVQLHNEAEIAARAEPPEVVDGYEVRGGLVYPPPPVMPACTCGCAEGHCHANACAITRAIRGQAADGGPTAKQDGGAK